MTLRQPGPQDVLLVIDVQNDFCPDGALAVPGGDRVVPVINDLIDRFTHVVLTQDWHPEGHSSFASQHDGGEPFSETTTSYGAQTLWPDHCVQGSKGAEFHAMLNWWKPELVIRKGFRPAVDSYSAFFENDRTTSTGLAGYLRERGFTHIWCVGLAFDFCVRYSAEDAKAQGFETTVIEDACRAIDMDGSDAATRAAFGQRGIEMVNSRELV